MSTQYYPQGYPWWSNAAARELNNLEVQGLQTLSASGYENTSAFGSPTVALSAQTLSPSGVVNTSTFGGPALSLYLAPTGAVNASDFGSATITQSGGLQSLYPTGVANAAAFGSAALGLSLSATGYENTSVFGSPVVLYAQALEPTGVVNTQSFGSAYIFPFSVDRLIGAIVETEIEPGITFRQSLRLLNAYIAGKTSGHPNSPTYRDPNDTKDRITGTVDAYGNRTAVSVDLT